MVISQHELKSKRVVSKLVGDIKAALLDGLILSQSKCKCIVYIVNTMHNLLPCTCPGLHALHGWHTFIHWKYCEGISLSDETLTW